MKYVSFKDSRQDVIDEGMLKYLLGTDVTVTLPGGKTINFGDLTDQFQNYGLANLLRDMFRNSSHIVKCELVGVDKHLVPLGEDLTTGVNESEDGKPKGVEKDAGKADNILQAMAKVYHNVFYGFSGAWSWMTDKAKSLLGKTTKGGIGADHTDSKTKTGMDTTEFMKMAKAAKVKIAFSGEPHKYRDCYLCRLVDLTDKSKKTIVLYCHSKIKSELGTYRSGMEYAIAAIKKDSGLVIEKKEQVGEPEIVEEAGKLATIQADLDSIKNKVDAGGSLDKDAIETELKEVETAINSWNDRDADDSAKQRKAAIINGIKELREKIKVSDTPADPKITATPSGRGKEEDGAESDSDSREKDEPPKDEEIYQYDCPATNRPDGSGTTTDRRLKELDDKINKATTDAARQNAKQEKREYLEKKRGEEEARRKKYGYSMSPGQFDNSPATVDDLLNSAARGYKNVAIWVDHNEEPFSTGGDDVSKRAAEYIRAIHESSKPDFVVLDISKVEKDLKGKIVGNNKESFTKQLAKIKNADDFSLAIEVEYTKPPAEGEG